MAIPKIVKAATTIVPQGEIALVVAADGAAIPSGRILGKVVECDNFQNARKFLVNGGEKGRQLGILTAGTYRINTALFTVITSAQAQEHGMEAHQLLLQYVYPDRVGIVTTLDGSPIEQGEIAGPAIANHDNFQNAQAFLEGGGRRGLQEQILLSGTWNLNPWFAMVEQVPMIEDSIGHVGVVISFVGKAHEDVSGLELQAWRPGGPRAQRCVGLAAASGQAPVEYAGDESRARADHEHRVELGHVDWKRTTSTSPSYRRSLCVQTTDSRSTWTSHRSSMWVHWTHPR